MFGKTSEAQATDTDSPIWPETRKGGGERPFGAWRRRPIAAVPATLMLLAAPVPNPASADDTYVEPSLSVALGHNDNLRLDPAEEDSQTFLEVIAAAELGALTRTREAVLDTAVHINSYSDSELNTTDWFLGLDLLKRSQRDELALSADYRRASTITTELEDTGRLRENQRREEFSIGPSWTYHISRRTETSLRYAFTDVAYQGGGDDGFRDYDNHFLAAGVSHGLSRTTFLYGRAAYTRFQSEEATESDNVSVLAGLEHDFSRRLQAGVGLGARYLDTESVVADGTVESESGDGLIYEAYATWQLKKGRVSVQATRQAQASGVGALSEQDRLQATWKRNLTRAWELNVNAAASRQDFTPAATRDDQERVYYNAGARMIWRGRPRWRVDLAYQHRRQEFDNPPAAVSTDGEDSAASNAVWLTMRYTWQRMDPFR